MMTIRFVLFLIITMMLPFTLDASEKPRKGVIEGKVIEAESKEPVEFANLAVFTVEDSALVSGAITGADGAFYVDDLPYGRYYVRIQFIGYKDRVINDITLTRENPTVDLGTLPIRLTAVQLEGTEIVAEKMAVEYKLDRKVINVSQDLSSVASSAVEILENVPSVKIDIEGNVYLRGSSNFTVFIDGKPTVLESSQALEQIPASTIDNIEIITNPSAKYDPDGTAGIININLKENQQGGFSGQADVTVGTGDKYQGDLYLNYRNSRFNLFGGVEWTDRQYSGEGRDDRETYSGDTIFRRESVSDRARLRRGLNYRGGIDLFLTRSATLSLGGEGGRYAFGFDNFEDVTFSESPASGPPEYLLSNNSFRWQRNYYSLSSTFRQEFDQDGHELTLFAFYSRRDGSQEQDKKEIEADENFNPVNLTPLLIRSTESGPSGQLRLEFDYARPVLGKGKVETGYRLRLDRDEEDYSLEQYDHDLGMWLEDENYGKATEFTRDIHSVFGTFSHAFGDFEYQLGLRGEYTFREIVSLGTDESATIDRFDLFPTVHLSKRFNEKNQLMASYSRRIDRPRGWYLEPFETYVDKDTRRIGNPGLEPEYTDSYELGYMRTLEKGSLSAEAYYRYTKNKITRLQYYDTGRDLLIHTFDNLNNDQSLGIEASALIDPVKWLNLNISGTYYYYQLMDNGEQAITRSSNNWDGRLMATFKLWSNTRLQLNGSYDSPSVTAQGRSESWYYMDVTARQDLFNKQLSITLKVSDIFATRVRERYSEGPGFSTYMYRNPESRVVLLTLTYRLNNFKQPASESFDDEPSM